MYLVEREPSIGGHMAQFDKTFPTLDCSACILTPKMVSVGTHPNITLLTWSEVEKVEGYVGNFTVTVRKKARKINEELCTGCGICQEKCPKKVIDDVYEAGLGYRKAVYTPFPQAVPNIPVMDVENCTYFEKGTCKACEKFCPTEAIDFNQAGRDAERSRLAISSWPPATTCSMPGGSPTTATAGCRTSSPRWSSSGCPTQPDRPAGTSSCEMARPRRRPWASSTVSARATGTSTTTVRSICCMQSLKFAHLVHERTGATVYNFYIDMRTPFKDYDEFYQRVLEEGTLFVRGKVAEVTDVPRLPSEEGKLIVQVEDTLAGKQRRIPVDMVILSAGLEPRHDSKETAKLFGISCSANGWYMERHPKLDPVATMTDGIFIAGCAQGPKDIPASVAQGAAAAARVLGKIEQKEIALEPVRASVIEEQVLRLPDLQRLVPIQCDQLP